VSTTKRWFAWVIKRNRFDIVVSYIKEHVPEVDQYFYPLIKKEYQTKKGVSVKDRPLYEGYLFLRYDSPEIVFHKLRSSPFITTFAGNVSEDEIVRMQAAQGKLLSELKVSKYLPGDQVVLLSGPFKGFDATISHSDGTHLQVCVNATILGQREIRLPVKEEEVDRKTELQNAEVQNLRE